MKVVKTKETNSVNSSVEVDPAAVVSGIVEEKQLDPTKVLQALAVYEDTQTGLWSLVEVEVDPYSKQTGVVKITPVSSRTEVIMQFKIAAGSKNYVG